MKLFKNRTVVGAVCIMLSLLICFGIAPLLSKTAEQKVEIVRVAREIKAGDPITEEMVRMVAVGAYNLPDNVMREKDQVVGMYAVADLSIGDYVLNTKLTDVPAVDNSYLYRLDGTKQAISVTIKSFATGLSGKLRSGDIVSVIAPDYRKQGLTVIPAELRYVEVIGVTAASGYDQRDMGPDQRVEDSERELPATVTLLVSPEQGKVLAELEADGKMHLSLAYRGDKANSDRFLSAQEEALTSLYPPEQAEEEVGEAPIPDTAEVMDDAEL